MCSRGADMDQQPQTYLFMWRAIEIEVTYTPRRWKVIDHLAIRSIKPEDAPLPITRTGYLSHFMQAGTVEAYGGDIVAQIVAWLDDEARSAEWREHLEAQRQLTLF